MDQCNLCAGRGRIESSIYNPRRVHVLGALWDQGDAKASRDKSRGNRDAGGFLRDLGIEARGVACHWIGRRRGRCSRGSSQPHRIAQLGSYLPVVLPNRSVYLFMGVSPIVPVVFPDRSL